MCPLDLLLGQVGTDEMLRLPAKSNLAYCWHTAPGMTSTAQRLLHIACKPHGTAATGEAADALSSAGFRSMTSPPSSTAPSSPLSPLPQVPDFASGPLAATESKPRSVLFPGEGRLQMQSSGSLKSPGRHPSDLQAHLSPPHDTLLPDSNRALRPSSSHRGLAWSESFDCTARSSCQLQLQLGDSQRCSVALRVHKVGLQWQVQLQPSFVMVNQTARTVHVHYTGQLADVSMSKMPYRGFKAGSPFALQPTAKVTAFLLLGRLHCSGCFQTHGIQWHNWHSTAQQKPGCHATQTLVVLAKVHMPLICSVHSTSICSTCGADTTSVCMGSSSALAATFTITSNIPTHLCTGNAKQPSHVNLQVMLYSLHIHTLLLQGEEGASCIVELMPLTTASGKGHLQVWLGSSQGWSLPVSLIHTNPQVCLSLCTSAYWHSNSP